MLYFNLFVLLNWEFQMGFGCSQSSRSSGAGWSWVLFAQSPVSLHTVAIRQETGFSSAEPAWISRQQNSLLALTLLPAGNGSSSAPPCNSSGAIRSQSFLSPNPRLRAMQLGVFLPLHLKSSTIPCLFSYLFLNCGRHTHRLPFSFYSELDSGCLE